MITIWVPKRLVEIDLCNVAARSGPELAAACEDSYARRLRYAAQKIRQSGAKIIMLTGPSASGKTTTSHKLAAALRGMGTPAQVISLDNFFRGSEYYPKMPDGTLDYEHPDTLDMPLIRQCLQELSQTDHTVLPTYDFVNRGGHPRPQPGADQPGALGTRLPHLRRPAGGVLPGGPPPDRHPGHPAVPPGAAGRRHPRPQPRKGGRSPEKTLAMWERVLDGETRYIKGFKNTADFLLDTAFTYELAIIAGLLPEVGRVMDPDSIYTEMWDETARRFEHVEPLGRELIPEGAMLREFYR